MTRTKTIKSFSLVHLWWFVALIAIIVAGIIFISIYNTDRIINRAKENQQHTTELFNLLRAEPEWKISTDSLGKAYIDSLKIPKSEQTKKIEEFLINQTTRQLTEYSEILAKEAASLNNTLIVWAGLLTLLAVIFTFLGFMELKERLASVDRKGQDIDNTIEKATEVIDNKVEEVHDALEEISDRKEEVERMQRVLNILTKRLDEVAQSSLHNLIEKEQQVNTLHDEVLTNTLLSTYNLYLQIALNKPSLQEKQSEILQLIKSVKNNNSLDEASQNKMVGECYFHIGLIYYDAGDSRSALDAYTEAINVYPNPVTYNNRGSIYVQLNQWNKAIQDFSAAINQKEDAVYFSNRGNIYYRQKKLALAIQDYDKAIEFMPENSQYRMSRGDVYACMNEVEKSLEDYNAAINIDAENDLYYYKRGNLYQFLEKNNLALTDYLKAIKLNAYVSDYYCARGDVYYQMGEQDMALQDYKQAIDLDPTDANIYVCRANLYIDTEQYENALEDYNKSIEIDDSNPLYYTSRANVLQHIGRTNEAISDYNKAIEIDDNFIKAYYSRAVLYSNTNVVKAIRDFRKCVELDTDSKLGYRVKASAQIEKLNKNIG